MKLYVKNIDSCQIQVCTMTAKYFRIPLEVIIVDKEMEETPEIKEKKGSGKYPFLETGNGTILF